MIFKYGQNRFYFSGNQTDSGKFLPVSVHSNSSQGKYTRVHTYILNKNKSLNESRNLLKEVFCI